MHMLQWNETELMSCLEVFPTIDEHSLCHEFACEQDDLRLAVLVYQYESRVVIRLMKFDLPEPLVDMTLRPCLMIRHTVPADGTPDYIECITGYKQMDNAVLATGVRIQVRPQIALSLLPS